NPKTKEDLSALLWSSLGLIVDNASAISSLNLLKKFLNDPITLKLLITHDNKSYFKKRYGSKYLENKNIFEKTWHEIIDITFEQI
ncbi:MAG: hypothetical protein Q8K60_08215, partial [Parachlamydiaceae bacterium]|nr:hypothetical protein [Parachlamydiaceae bacterium]